MKKQARAKDTRRKILLGALVLHHLEQSKGGDQIDQWVRRELPGFLTRKEDKGLFDDLLSSNNHQATEQTSKPGE